jgi:hypothetical protein
VYTLIQLQNGGIHELVSISLAGLGSQWGIIVVGPEAEAAGIQNVAAMLLLIKAALRNNA